MPDKQKLLSAINWAEENSYGQDSDALSADRAYSIKLYQGENVDPAPVRRSQVTDRSVFETIQWIMPSLCRIFANGSDLVSIPPIGQEDEEGAKQEAEYLNWVMTQSNPWFQIFHTWATDALMTRNAYAMAYKDKRRSVDIEAYENQTQEGVALLMQDKDVEVVSAEEIPGEPEPVIDEMGQPPVDPMTGQPILDEQEPLMQPTSLYNLKLRRVGQSNKTCIKVLPPERCKISQFTSSYRIVDADYFEYWEYKTISELRAEGFDIPDDIANDEFVETEEDVARDLYEESRTDQKGDSAMRRIKARMIWIRHDYDEDGIAELLYVVRLGRTEHMPVMEETTSIPVACIVPMPMPHRHMGMSITDIVADIQRIKTTILRQGLDNLYLSNNPQKVINENLVNLDDCLQNVPGGIVRTQDVNQIRYEIPPFVFPQAMEGLEYMDQIKENRTGTNRYFTGIDQNALNKTATGIQQLSTMAAQRVEQIARILGSGVEDLARVVHELELRMGHKKETIKLRGQWVEVDPGTWKKRTDFKIAVGFASGNKDAMVTRLQMISQSQLMALQLGLPIVQPQNVYETMLELAKASDFSSPERFWTDPSTVEQQQPPPDPETQKLKGEMVAKEAELQLQQESAQSDAMFKQVELGLKEKELQQKAQLEKYKIDTDAQVRLETARMQGQNAISHEKAKSDYKYEKDDKMRAEDVSKLDAMVDELKDVAKASVDQAKVQAEVLSKVVETFAEAVEKMNAPKTIIRDKSGRAVGVKAG